MAGGKLEHCRQYARQTGMDMAEAMAKFGLEEPEIPEGFEIVMDWFFELSETRCHNGFSWLPLTWAEIGAWAQLTGIGRHAWLASALRAMDRQWLAALAKDQEKRKPKGNSHA